MVWSMIEALIEHVGAPGKGGCGTVPSTLPCAPWQRSDLALPMQVQNMGEAVAAALLNAHDSPHSLPPGSSFTKAPVWLAQSNRCKTGPSKAVAGRSVVSVA